jgi:hypothetical protein
VGLAQRGAGLSGYLVVWFISLLEPEKPNRPDKPNEQDKQQEGARDIIPT